MRINCPVCGERDRREFHSQGAALARPDADAGLDSWHGYVHLRENPAGVSREFWQHASGCGAWLVVTRDTLSHAVLDAALAREEGL